MPKKYLNLQPCACGCGELIRPRWRYETRRYSRYKHGHWQKTHPSPHRLLNQDQERIIIEKYQVGTSQKALAEMFNATRPVIRRTLQRASIPLRSLSESHLRYKANIHYFNSIDEPAKAYWLGFIAADGSVTARPGCYRLELMLSWRDKEHVKLFRSCISGNQPIHQKIVKEKYPQARLSISGKPICDALLSLGITPRKSLSLKYPPISSDLNRHFLRGYVDGDGHIGRSIANKQLVFDLLGTFEFLNSAMQILVSACDLQPVKIGPAKQGSKIFRLGYCGNRQVPRILAYLYKDAVYYLHRKARYYFDWLQSHSNNGSM